MTPESAADLLGIAVDATPPEIEAAFTRRARETHPDRFAGAPPAALAQAHDDFIGITDARALLLAMRSDRPNVVVRAPSVGVWPIRIWTALLVPGAVLGLSGSAIPLPWMLVLVPLLAAVVTLAVTAQRRWFLATIVLAVAYALLTAAFATFGSLLTLEVLLPPIIAILVLRRGRAANRFA
jgi:hypothetical protein